jgi:hypothetical protein
MVNKREKNEGPKKVATITAPKGRVATKPKAASRVAEAAKIEKVAKPVKAKAAKPAAKPAVKPVAEPVAVSHDDIAFRAYLIAEKRTQLGLPGDSLSDWVEAERQLRGKHGTHGVN